ncbi:hypothetical protein [Bacillus sp. CBEL-1]|uniref:hypothetical protein n=1 Tax=Bacillus sp. CBEL-1 TaxID=2502980 RepID=UPI001049E04F|nr:hypothetical protein [Bacillus sp. CBEL-1]TDB49710.1 hypothetical protein EPL02_11475 [Bacillus sp. CBEL-1]
MFIKGKGIVALLLSSLFVGGCQMSDEQSRKTKPLDQKPSEVAIEELPNARALQDEFTRDMIKSTKETEKGYYTLESKTGEYEMLFPAGGGISETLYSYTENQIESYVIGAVYDDQVEAQIRINYNQELYNDKKGVSYSIDFLTNNLGISSAFEKVDLKNRTLYIAPFKVDEDAVGYAAYVHPKSQKGGVKVVYSVGCNQLQVQCEPSNEKIKDRAHKVMSSITFK